MITIIDFLGEGQGKFVGTTFVCFKKEGNPNTQVMCINEFNKKYSTATKKKVKFAK